MRHAAFASDGNAERLDCTHVISKFCQSEERHGGRKSGNNERMADCHPPEQRWIVIAIIIFLRGSHCGLGVLSGIWTSQARALRQQEVSNHKLEFAMPKKSLRRFLLRSEALL